MKRILVFSSALLAAAACCAEIVLTSPGRGAVMPLLTPPQKAYRALSTADRRARFAQHDFRTNEMGLPAETVDGKPRRTYYPQTVRLAWNMLQPCDVRVAAQTTGRVVFEGCVTGGVCHVEGLEVAQAYEWSVTCGGERADSQFVTEDLAPRMLADPFVPNVRDLGGRIGLDGRRVRQGLVFRSAGLNDNASAVRASSEGLARADPDGRIAALVPTLAQRCAEWRALSAEGAGMTFAHFRLPPRWTGVRLPDGLTQLRAAALFAGFAADGHLPDAVRGESVEVVPAAGVLQLGTAGDGRWCALTGTLEAAADGYAMLGCCADWYWAIAVNGVPVRDYLGGNRRMPAEGPYEICVPVRKGANVVRIVAGSGSSDFYVRLIACAGGHADEKTVAHEIDVSAGLAAGLQTHSDGFAPGATRIRDSNRAFWRETLGIRTDIDLRSDRECFGMTGSPLGEDVAWVHVPFYAYDQFVTPQGRKAFARAFRVFLDRRNYPIDFHCIAGQDRTGSLAYVLNALLGVAEDELLLDWEWTGFWNRNYQFNHVRLLDKLSAALKAQHPAPTIRETAEGYVLASGFTAEDIATFRAILLE